MSCMDKQIYPGFEVKIEMHEVSNLVGKLLTIIDASYHNESQKEAVKSLVKRTVWEWGRDWHFAANEEQLRAMESDAEEAEGSIEEQIPHYEE